MTLYGRLSMLLALMYQNGMEYNEKLPKVKISEGILMGRKVQPSNGSPYFSFEGIPYAKPPVGPLRFKAPEAPEPWQGVRKALRRGPNCLEPDQGDENCLFLNVYTPKLPAGADLLPVMVWFFGGGFTSTSWNLENNGPVHLVNESVVCVSMNYRVGVMGFLSTEDEVVPGNAGLKDQVQALRWIKQNIAEFGGDHNKVTLFGNSAGGGAIQFHILSPMSKGLFHRAISQSGTALNSRFLAYKPREHAFLLGKTLGYYGNDSEDLATFLRNRTASELIEVADLIKKQWEGYRLIFFPYIPSVERQTTGEEPFIPDEPIKLLESGNYNEVPYISGINSEEGKYTTLAGGLIEGRWTLEDIDEKFVDLLKPFLRYDIDETEAKEVVSRIRSYYFGDLPINNSTIEILIKLFSDLLYNEPVLTALKIQSSRSHQPVYLYEFSYDEGIRYQNFTLPDNWRRYNSELKIGGVSHTDELPYLFDIGKPVSETSTDAEVRRRLVKMWTDFAKTGNPVPEPTSEFPAWPPYTLAEEKYLEIGRQLTVRSGLKKERLDFLESLIENVRRNMTDS